jgi:hypothetical protein
MEKQKKFLGMVAAVITAGMILSACATTKYVPMAVDPSVPAAQCATIVLHKTLSWGNIDGKPLFPPPKPGDDLMAYGKKIQNVRAILIPAGEHDLTFGFVAHNALTLNAYKSVVAKMLEGKMTFEAGKTYEAYPNAKSDLDYKNATEVKFAEQKQK